MFWQKKHTTQDNLDQQGIGLRVILLYGFLGIVFAISAVIFLVINKQGTPAVVAETNQTIEQTGNNAVHELEKLLDKTATLTKATATMASSLPLDEKQFSHYLKALNEDQSYASLEGFGVWPEPHAFSETQKRFGFYWARDDDNAFVRYTEDNDASKSPLPYWIDEWYVIGKYANKNKTVWTDPYIDTTNGVSMVTCTTGIYRDNQFFGVSQLDIRLDRFANKVKEWQQKTGGYAFVTGSDNRFIAFPEAQKKLELFMHVKTDKLIKSEIASITLQDLAKKSQSFQPIAQVFKEIDDLLLSNAKRTHNFQQKVNGLANDSQDLNQRSALLRATVMQDVFENDKRFEKTQLFRIVPIKNDAILGVNASAYIFHVPHTYWKYVVVKPSHEITNVANQLVDKLIAYLLPIIILSGLLSYYFANKMVFKPLLDMSRKMTDVTQLLSNKDYDGLAKYQNNLKRNDEIGLLNDNINLLLSKVVENEDQLASINRSLEQKVETRTADLVKAMKKLKSSQAKLVNSEKMAALGQMVAGVAHEVNTPLGYIRNNITMMQDVFPDIKTLIQQGHDIHTKLNTQDTLGKPLDSQLKETISTLIDLCHELYEDEVDEDADTMIKDTLYGIDQIADMVKNLKDFARVDEANIKNVYIHECIESALTIARGNLASTQVIKKYSNVPLVSCSPSKINQVLLNIINNAIHASGKNGVITISTSVKSGSDVPTIYQTSTDMPIISEKMLNAQSNLDDQTIENQVIEKKALENQIIEIEKAKTYAVIDIQDNGIGISPEDLPHIFEPFFSTKAAGDGTGLGLAISKQIIEGHYGTLTATSVPNKGSCFTIYLPI